MMVKFKELDNVLERNCRAVKRQANLASQHTGIMPLWGKRDLRLDSMCMALRRLDRLENARLGSTDPDLVDDAAKR